MSGDSIRVTTVVAVDPAVAFDVFTAEIDAWWQRGAKYRFHSTRHGTMRLEPQVGGRLLEIYDEGDSVEMGRVLAWEPPGRVLLEWRARNFEPGERTEVEISFERDSRGTRVTLVHRGWAALPDDHPVRHGLGRGTAFASMIGVWWGEVLGAMRAHAEAR